MRKWPMLLTLPVLFAFCGTPKQIKGTGGGPVPLNKSTSGKYASETVAVAGVEYIPVEGRKGVRADLQGTWVLQSLNGIAITETGKLNVDVANKSLASEGAKRYDNGTITGKEIRRDSTVTKLKNGSTQTETTVYITNDNRGNNITPPQGSNYHIPERPHLSFYGANVTFSGFTGCNKISGRYTISGKNSISFQNSAPSTRMVCIGDYDENVFYDALRRVNTFRASNNKLELMDGDKVVLVFAKK